MQTNTPKVVHLRREIDGKVQRTGGYAVAVKLRMDGRYAVTISQCNEKQRYDERLGEKIATSRMAQGKFFVNDADTLNTTLQTLRLKLGHRE